MANVAGQLLPGGGVCGGQRLKVFTGDRHFRPARGHLGPALSGQALPDAVFDRQGGQNVVIGDVADARLDRQTQNFHFFHRLLGQGHAADVQIVELCGGSIIYVFRWNRGLLSVQTSSQQKAGVRDSLFRSDPKKGIIGKLKKPHLRLFLYAQ